LHFEFRKNLLQVRFRNPSVGDEMRGEEACALVNLNEVPLDASEAHATARAIVGACAVAPRLFQGAGAELRPAAAVFHLGAHGDVPRQMHANADDRHTFGRLDRRR
jgi:hypothetical protein